MKSIKLFFISFLILLNSYGQEPQTYLSHYELDNNITSYSLTDSSSKVRFLLDSSRIIITAIDKNGKILWQTDPWKDNNIMEYRFKRPQIVYFDFGENNNKSKEGVIWITYNNSQFGTIDKTTGKFDFHGQD